MIRIEYPKIVWKVYQNKVVFNKSIFLKLELHI
jgi:hypothetical protein